MASVWFQNGQRIIVQVLNWLQNVASNYTGARIEDYSQFGICKFLAGEFTVTAGSNNTPTTPSVSVGNGVAYDVNNLRVVVSDTNTYNSSNPTQTTNDGTGNLVLTPQNTGSQNIPLTVNSQNYVWIQYLLTVDTSVFTLQDVTLAKQFYKQTDGYEFLVTTTNTPPSSSALFIANINLTGSGVVSPTTISQAGRVYTGNVPYRTYIQTPASDLSDRTTSYSIGNNNYFADVHTKAVGTGVVSATNAHGLSPADIGLSGASTIQFHQQFLHSPGLVGATDNLQAQIISVIPGFDRLVVNPIGPNEVITSNGISLTNTDIPLPTTLQYTNTDGAGLWYIYVDVVNKVVSRTQTNIIATPNPNQYVIYTVIYTFPDPDSGNGHLSALSDLRVFGNIATRELQNGSVTGIKINPSALSPVGALSQDGSGNLRVNYDNVTMTISGDALAVIPGGLAGSGLVASGHFLNVNPDNSTINIVSNQVGVANNGITGLQINPSVAGNGLSGGGGSPLSVNVDNSTLQITGDTLSVRTQGITATQILNGTITNAQIANATITNAQIASGTILTSNIGNNQITTPLILANAVTTTQIADSSVSQRAVITVNFSGSLGVSYVDVATYTFTVPATTAPAFAVIWWNGTHNGGIGLKIDSTTLISDGGLAGSPFRYNSIVALGTGDIFEGQPIVLTTGSHTIHFRGGSSLSTLTSTAYLLLIYR